MLLMDADTGAVLAEKNCDTPSLIASTTKIMTALVVVQRCDLDRRVRIPAEATGIEGSSMYLKAGEELTLRDLLYGMMLRSGNDAAVALALCTAGSLERFVGWMNETAQRMELRNTRFANPNGLDDENNYSTARDLALLTRAALREPDFLQVVSTKSIRVGERCLTNHNKLLWSLEGAIGVKTGFTRAAGRILVSAVERGGRRMIAVTINDCDDWRDHAALYAYGFSLYGTRTVLQKGAYAAELTLMDGSRAALTAGQDFACFLRKEEAVTVRVSYDEVLGAPEKRNTETSGTKLKKHALGGYSDQPAIFGEAGGEWAIPERKTERTRALLRQAAAGSGFTPNEVYPEKRVEKTAMNFTFAPTIYAGDAGGVKAALEGEHSEMMSLIEEWWNEKMRERERVSFA